MPQGSEGAPNVADPVTGDLSRQIPHLYCNTTVRIRTGITPQKYLDAIFPPVKSDEATAVQKWSKARRLLPPPS